jgi:DNA-binding MarR family transcriptional regulator
MLELAPLVMRTMRAELSARQGLELSVPQFRALRFVGRRPGISLSDLAAHLGTTRPAASRLVDRLLEVGLLDRAVDPSDRRQVALALTERGQLALQGAHAAAQARMAERLGGLTPDELGRCAQALATLRALFPSDHERGG